MSAGTARRWVSADQLLRAVDEHQEATPLPPRPRPVFPAPDETCFALNPPEEISASVRAAGLTSLTGRRYSGARRAKGGEAGQE